MFGDCLGAGGAALGPGEVQHRVVLTLTEDAGLEERPCEDADVAAEWCPRAEVVEEPAADGVVGVGE